VVGFLRNQWTEAHVSPLALLLPRFPNKTVFFQSDFKASLWKERWGRKEKTKTTQWEVFKNTAASTLDCTYSSKGVG